MGFRRLFDPALVRAAAVSRIRLADPPRASLATTPGHLEVYRPGAARHAGRILEWLMLEASQPAQIVAPCKAVVRRVQLDATTTALELSPLPFADDLATVLRALRPGAPTFYVAPFEDVPALADEMRIDAGTAIARLPNPDGFVRLAVQFQDPFPTPARSWIGVIHGALAVADRAEWLTQLDALDPVASLTVVDHVGELAPNAAIEIAIVDGTSTIAAETRTTDGNGDLEAALRADPILSPAGPVSSLYVPPPGHTIELRPHPDASAEIPVLAFYEPAADPTRASAIPGRALVMPLISDPRMAQRTLQRLDLGTWLQPPRADLAAQTAPQRFHPDCRVEPLVDGAAVFERLRTELANATGPGFGAHFLGWTFNDFPFGLEPDARTFLEHVETVLASQGEIRILTNRFINLSDADVPNTQLEAGVLLLLLVIVLGEVARRQGETSTVVAALWFALPLSVLLANVVDVPDLLTKMLPFPDARPVLEAVNERAGVEAARFSPPRASIDDNPLADGFEPSPLFGIERDIASVGANHTKMQLVRYHDAAEPDEPAAAEVSHVAYVGGIDVNKNRRDTPSHHLTSYHDVHARLRGPVVADAFKAFAERWDVDGEGLALDVATPDAETLRRHVDDPHLAQLARTYHAPRTPGSPSAWSFAPSGDDGCYRGMRAAIAAARDVLYIEDQYFTPDDRWLDVLVGAADRCQRLAILVPDTTDQPFGSVRQRVVLDHLAAAWGDRMVVGMPTVQAVLPHADATASVGRAVLFEDCPATSDTIEVGPPIRVPSSAPTWCWIHGELMLVTEISGPIEPPSGPVRRRLRVVRGATQAAPRWSASTRDHARGSPVTFAGIRTTFVHAKCMTVDDVFASIGSTNVNRRGFFHDGEANVFVVPQRLHASDDNPARNLRTQLWAEQLGLPPELGRSLLRDPLAAFDLFLRPRLLGNRYTPLSVVDSLPFMGITDLALYPLTVFQAAGLLGAMVPAAVQALHERAWNLGGDPTSGLDPDPRLGPPYHPA